MSPTELSLRELRKQGYTAQVVEKFNQFAGVRQDLFGFIDIVAIKPNVNGVLGIQATSRDHISHRSKKITDSNIYPIWIGCGNQIEVWGWRKEGARWQVMVKKLPQELIEPKGLHSRT